MPAESPDDDGPVSDLVDLAGFSLAEVCALPESVLGRSLLRILDEADSSGEPVAGFQSAI